MACWTFTAWFVGYEGSDGISGIDYEAHHAMASHQLHLLADEACEKFPLLGLTLHHRVGFVGAAEASLFLRVSAAHRGPAFAAAQWVIEQLKLRVPIWKHPVSAGGSHEPALETIPAESSPDSVA